MTTFRCPDISGLAGVLVGRRALALASIGDFSGQMDFYRRVDKLLLPLKVKYQTLSALGATKVYLRERAAGYVLMNARLNDEPSDPTTVSVADVMKVVDSRTGALLATAGCLASLNGREFTDRFCQLVHEHAASKPNPGRRAIFKLARSALAATRPEGIFTHNFNRQASRSLRKRELASQRLRKVRQFAFRKLKLRIVDRRTLSLACGSSLGTLLGKNCFSTLEQHFWRK